MTWNYFPKLCCFRMSSLPDCPPYSLTLSHPPAGELVSEGAGRPPSPALIKQSRQGDLTEAHTSYCIFKKNVVSDVLADVIVKHLNGKSLELWLWSVSPYNS